LHVHHPASLARRAGVSESNFGRIFQTEIGLKPTRHVAQQMLETARRMLEETVFRADFY